MGKGQTDGVPHTPGPTAGVSAPPTEAEVRGELTRVLAGHEFRASKRSQEFLRYIIDNTLAGHAGILKERTIGIEVFGRAASYDPSEDATVRVKASEVRRRLGLYYAGEGVHNPLRIDLPMGSYVPEFRHTATVPPTEVPQVIQVVEPAPTEPVQTVAEPVATPERPRRIYRTIAAAVLLLGALAAIAWVFSHRETTSAAVLDDFWSPVLQGNAPVSVCAAYVPLLGRSAQSQEPFRPEFFTLYTDQFVGGGDLIAVSRLSSLLTRRNRAYRVRIGNEISLHDLEDAPAILIGYSHTHWKAISSELRYFIDASRNPVGITDAGRPTKWVLPTIAPGDHPSEDYAIVSRVFHPDTHAMLVGLAGITQYGTDAASDLVTNAALLSDALQSAPKDWRSKNLQIVVHVKVVAGAPSSPRVVASHFW